MDADTKAPTTALSTALIANQQMAQILACQTEDLVGRYNLARMAGLTYSGQRDMFGALGYTQNPTYEHFRVEYETTELGQRVIDAYPDKTWGNPPEVYDSEDEGIETPFEKAFKALVKRFKLWDALNRADKLAGLGRYSVLLLGLPGETNVEPTGGRLLYLMPYSELTGAIMDYETDPENERFGFPKNYNIQTNSGTVAKTFVAHYSRAIHICEGNLDNTIFGKPRLAAIYNRINDITKIVGGGAEMFWRAAFKGLHFNIDKDATGVTTESLDDLKKQIDEYANNLRRVIRTQGVDVNSLTGETADPTGIFMVAVQLISCASGIPMRILLGSERGELASSQDTQEFNERVSLRMKNHAEINMLRPLIDRLIELKVLPKPQGGEYEVEWPDLMALKDSERADIAKKLAEGANTLAPGAGETVITREEFRVSAGFPAVPEGGFEDEEIPLDENTLVDPENTPPENNPEENPPAEDPEKEAEKEAAA